MTYKTYRPLSLRLVALVALLVSLAFAGMTAASPAHAAAPANSFYGLSETGPGTDSTLDWSRIESSGAKTVRVEFNWKRDFYGGAGAVSCPSSPLPSGSISWSVADYKVKHAAMRGIEILPYLTGSFCSQGYPEPGSAEMTAWQTFVDDLGDRYGPGGTFWAGDWDGTPATYTAVPINTWEVGNEPNLPQNNPGGTVDPQKYGKLLVLTSAAIKGSQPSATVLLGGLTTAVGGSTSVSNFLNDVYNPNPSYPCCVYTASQLNSAFDGLSLHPYELGSSHTAVINDITATRTALNAKTSTYGADKPIWITEFGWTRASNIVADCSSTATVNVNSTQQAFYTSQLMSWMVANHDLAANLKLASWQTLVDSNAKCGTGPEVAPANYGVDYSKGKMGLTGPAILIQSHTPPFCSYVAFSPAPSCVSGPALGSSPKTDQALGSYPNVSAWVNILGHISYCSFTGSIECGDLNSGLAATTGTDAGVSVDPTTGATRIIYRASNGQLGVYQRSSWSGAWTPLTKGSVGDIAAGTSPGVFRSGNSGSLTLITDIVFRNSTSGQLMHQAETILGWTTATPIAGTSLATTATPAVTRNGSVTRVVYREPWGRLAVTEFSGGWSTSYYGAIASVDANANPTIAHNNVTGTTAVVYRTSADQLGAWNRSSGGVWTNQTNATTVPTDSDPSVTFNDVNGTYVAAFRTTADGISLWTRNAGGTWGAPAGITPVSPPVVPIIVSQGTDPSIALTDTGSGIDHFIPFTDGTYPGLYQRMGFVSGSTSGWSVPIMP